MNYRRGLFPTAVACLGFLVARKAARGAQPEPTETVPSAWLEQIQTQLGASEYRFSLDRDGSWSAPNRAQNLRSKLVDSGILVTSRTNGEDEARDGFSLGVTLSAWGRAGALQTLDDATTIARDNRLERRSNGLTESYFNDPRGLRQGFSIDARAGRRNGRELVLRMKLLGQLGAFPSEDGKSVLFKSAQGAPVLRYSELEARDATGRDLNARIAISTRTLELRIHDQDAVYPLAVTALIGAPAWIVNGGQSGARFGTEVATTGDVNGDGFSDVIVGAPSFDNGQTDEGAAFLFYGSPAGPSSTPSWMAESDQAGAGFSSRAMGTAGDVNGDGYDDVVIGAESYDNGQTDEGMIFVWYGSASGPTPNGTPANANWSAESNDPGAHFGRVSATAGDVNGDGYADVVAGAYAYDNGAQVDEGRAFVWYGSAAGLGASGVPGNADWSAGSGQAGSNYGIAVSSAGDVNGDGYADLLVGASGFASPQAREGRAFLYLGASSGLAPTPAWTAESDQASAEFGAFLGMAGDVNGDGYSDVIIGSYLWNGTQTDEGRAFAWYGGPGGLGPNGTPSNADWSVVSGQAGAQLGSKVGTAGDVNGDGFADVVVGVFLYDGGQADEGQARVYLGSATGLATTPAFAMETNQPGATVLSIAAAGDVNGDGYSDVIVGAPAYDTSQVDEGRAFLFFGEGDRLATTPAWDIAAALDFTDHVASAGDVNGDGYSDVIVGLQYYDEGQADRGRVDVYHGSRSGLATTPSWTAKGAIAGARLGSAVGSAGDVNGDGYDDLIVAAGGQARAYEFDGSPSGLAPTASWTVAGGDTPSFFSYTVAAAGDVNGDGYGDVIVAAGSQARISVFHGSAAGLSVTPTWTMNDDPSSDFSIATAGDVNGDGFSDVLISGFQNLGGTSGNFYAFYGSPTGLDQNGARPTGSTSNADWTATGNILGFGDLVFPAGDVNGDGYSDVMTVGEKGAWLFHGSSTGLDLGGTRPAGTIANADWGRFQDPTIGPFVTAGDVNGDGYSDAILSLVNDGVAWILLGSATGLPTTPSTVITVGSIVAPAGDVNGDGFSDVITNLYNTGRAHLHYGGGGAGLARTPRQALADASAPIALLGKTDSSDAFRMALVGRTPAGRGLVRMQFEIKPLDQPFTGTPLEQTDVVDTGAPGVAGSVQDLDASAGLAAGPIKWRARIASADPFFPRTPWFSVPGNARTETDLRSSCVMASPSGSPVLTLRKLSPQLSWTAVGSASQYDVVRGSLAALRSSSGDFTTAVTSCVVNDEASTAHVDASTPQANFGLWFLVRAGNCAGSASYDTGAPRQLGSRDDEIQAAGGACP